MADSAQKQSLIASLQEARGQLAENLGGLRQDLNVKQRLQRNVRRNRTMWYAGAAVVGLLLAKIPPIGRRKVVVQQPVVYQKTGGRIALLMTLAKFALDLGKPAILAWAAQRVAKDKPSDKPRGTRRPMVGRFG